jgi:hypothetical protein
MAVVWFGDLSSLKTDGDNISGESKYFVPDWSRMLGKVALAVQIIVSLGKVTFQVMFYKFTKVVLIKHKIYVLILIGIEISRERST